MSYAQSIATAFHRLEPFRIPDVRVSSFLNRSSGISFDECQHPLTDLAVTSASIADIEDQLMTSSSELHLRAAHIRQHISMSPSALLALDLSTR